MMTFTRLCLHFVGLPVFDIARNTMTIVYAQSAMWVGLYFAPPLPFVLVIILILTYNVKKVSQ